MRLSLSMMQGVMAVAKPGTSLSSNKTFWVLVQSAPGSAFSLAAASAPAASVVLVATSSTFELFEGGGPPLPLCLMTLRVSCAISFVCA